MNTLIEMQRLAASRPPATAGPAAVADWYEAKAVLHAHLALERPSPAEHARTAHQHAQHLRKELTA